MSTFIQKVRGFVQDEQGVTAIEYGLIAALIAVGLVAALTLVGNDLKTVFNTIADDLNAAIRMTGRRTAGPARSSPCRPSSRAGHTKQRMSDGPNGGWLGRCAPRAVSRSVDQPDRRPSCAPGYLR